MPFQPLGSINTALWRYQSFDPISGFTTENYINLIEMKKMKIYRDAAGFSGSPPVANVGPNPKVWLWFDTDRVDTRDADLTLSGLEAIAFIADLDAIYI
jgi:hypothetical protein